MERGRFSPLLTESSCQHVAREHGGQKLHAAHLSAATKGCNAPTCEQSSLGEQQVFHGSFTSHWPEAPVVREGCGLRSSIVGNVASFFVWRVETSGLCYSTCWNAESPIKFSPLWLTATPPLQKGSQGRPDFCPQPWGLLGPDSPRWRPPIPLAGEMGEAEHAKPHWWCSAVYGCLCLCVKRKMSKGGGAQVCSLHGRWAP